MVRGLEAVVGDLLQRALAGDRLVVAINPGKVQHRVWLTTNVAGLVAERLTLPFASCRARLRAVATGAGGAECADKLRTNDQEAASLSWADRLWSAPASPDT